MLPLRLGCVLRSAPPRFANRIQGAGGLRSLAGPAGTDMRATRRARFQLLAQNGIFAALLIAAALLLAQLAGQHSRQWDLTQNSRNSLSEGTLQLLRTLDGPVTITAYSTEQDPTLGDIRRQIADFIARYQRIKPDIALKFVDPQQQPKATATANIRANGEMVVELAGRSEHLTNLDESSLTNLLTRLARSHERLVMFLAGHGERNPGGIANHDLGEFGKRLETKGFKVSTLNLAAAQDVPANAAVLVIATPQVDLLPAETTKLAAWLERGGSLLWLLDQEPLHGLQPIADALHLELSPGVVVDPAANDIKASATLAIAFNYPNHPVTRGFVLNSAFPLARRIGHQPDDKVWRFSPLVETAQRGWIETGALDDKVAFDKARDMPGPVTVAGALERDLNGKPQRVIVTGSGHFVANTYAGLLGNLDLGINMVNWLAGDDALIAIQPKSLVDGNIELSRAWLLFIGLAFIIAVPGAFLFTGGMLWWRRRRA